MDSSVNSFLSVSTSHPAFIFCHFPKRSLYPHFQLRDHQFRCSTSSLISFAQRRHHRRRRQPDKRYFTNSQSPSSNQKLQMIVDVEHWQDEASLSMKRLLVLSELKVNEFIQSGSEAMEDLRNLVTIESDNRVLVSCRWSTVRFLGDLAILCLVVVFTFRLLVKLGLQFRERFGYGHGGNVVYRRDRSLGGKVVAVGRNKNVANEFMDLANPLSPAGGTTGQYSEVMTRNWARKGREERLPKWWPVLLPPPVVTINKEEYQRMAKRLIRAIMDNKVHGKDISKDDIIQLRRICRMSGIRVSLDTINARDSFYRASVNFVLNVCCSTAHQSALVEIDGEDVRQFVSGLADNIGLVNNHAARIVSAAVAAWTRSCFVQAWALEMQGKHHEALAELKKVCLIHQIFPPDQGSPEIEMVARGLQKHLKLEQRESLMNMFACVCGEESRRSVAESLGLCYALYWIRKLFDPLWIMKALALKT